MSVVIDRREVPRNRALKGAKIVFNGGASVLTYVIRDLSDKGARLKIDTIIGAPDRFSLQIMNQDARPCHVVWQANRELGVVFD